MNKKYIYMVQGQASLIKDYKHLANRCDSDAVFLTYDAPLDDAIFYPNSSWDNGRNKLLEAALAKGEYEYYIFCDDDVAFIKGNWDEFEKQLQLTQPAIAVPVVPKTSRKRATFKLLKHQSFLVNDEQMIALHRSVIRDRIVAPYFHIQGLFVWMSCEIQESLIQSFYPYDSIQFNTVEIANEGHRYEVDDQAVETFRDALPKWLSEQFSGDYQTFSFSRMGFFKIFFRTILFNTRRLFKKPLSFTISPEVKQRRIKADSDLGRQVNLER